MVQVKKVEVRDAITASAYRLFRSNGYVGTAMSDIGRAAGVTTSNIYRYFDSKLSIFYAVYEPWLKQCLLQLERQLKTVRKPRTRLRLILKALWIDIPSEDSCFANNLMQAVSTATREEIYSSELLLWCEDLISRLVRTSLPPSRSAVVEQRRLAHILFMAFDGFVVRSHVGARSENVDEVIDTMVDLILGQAAVVDD
jgi:AcrR family transcriptional regulator